MISMNDHRDIRGANKNFETLQRHNNASLSITEFLFW